MPIGAFKLNAISKFTVTAVAQVIRVKKSVTAVGNAQVDTAQSKFGGASALFDGTGDRLDIASHSSLAFGTTDFTIECWIRYNSTTGNQTIIDFRSGSSVNILLGNDGGSVYLYVDGAYRIGRSGTQFVTGQFYHVALSRSGTSTRLFINGTQVHSTYTDTNSYVGNDPSIGEVWRSSGFGTNGWIDEFRISNSARYTANFTPSTVPFVNDDNTILLIHADGTDATTFFEDDNGVTRSQIGISAHGTAALSTTQSKFGGTSLDFGDGVSDYYKANAPIANYFGGTGDMTFEFWYYRKSTGSGLHITDFRPTGSDSGSWTIVDFEDGRLGLRQNGYLVATNFGMTTLTWIHVAIVKQGTTLKWYKNGTLTDTNTGVDTTFTSRLDCFIGANYADQSAGNNANAYMDEIRISNTARYFVNFTAPTAPFVNDSNTLLLIHADGTNASTVVRDDNGSNGKNMFTVGNAQISTAQSKFGGSSYLGDGTGDVLRTYSTNLTTGNFTIEFWVYATTVTGDQHMFSVNGPGTAPETLGLSFLRNGTTIKIYASPGNAQWDIFNGVSIGTISVNTWAHLAITRNGSTWTGYVNGVATSIGTSASNLGSSGFIDIGGLVYGGVSSFTGYIDEVRVSNIARYTGTFTPATAPFQPDSNTLLLLHMNGTNGSTTFIDSTSRSARGIQAIGNAQVDNTQSQFGGTSLLLDGTGDYLNISPFTGIAPGTGDFTFEAWIRLPNNNVDYGIFGHDGFNGDLMIRRVNDGTLRIGRDDVAWDLTSSVLSIANVWTHIAVCRTDTTARIFVNGTQVASGANSQNYVLTNVFRIGSGANMGVSDFNGWIDEVRISNTGRYTANFTPSTTPFQNDANTLLLLHMDGTDASTVFVDDNGKTTA